MTAIYLSWIVKNKDKYIDILFYLSFFVKVKISLCFPITIIYLKISLIILMIKIKELFKLFKSFFNAGYSTVNALIIIELFGFAHFPSAILNI